MTDPIISSVAAAVAAAATTAIADGGRALITKLAALLRERSQREVAGQSALAAVEQTTLAAVEQNPQDAVATQRLAELLDQRMRDDPVFAHRLRELWEDTTSTASGQVANTVSGEVRGSVIQARDVHGGITFTN